MPQMRVGKMLNKLAVALLIVLLGLCSLGAELGNAVTTAGTLVSNYATLYAGVGGSYSYQSNTVNTVINGIHGLDLNTNLSQTILPGQTVYFPKVITNVGNVTEAIDVLISPITAGWSVQLIEDNNNDGVHQIGETTPVPATLNMLPSSLFKFFVSMAAPSTFNVTGTVNITVSASASALVTSSYTGNNLLAYGGPLISSALNTAMTTAAPAGNGPTITDVQFDGVQLVNRDYVGRTPLIKAKIIDTVGVSTSAFKVIIDGTTYTAGITFDGTYMEFKVPAELGVGNHTIAIEASNVSGDASTKTIVVRITEKSQIVGEVLSYPNPFNPQEGDVDITYQLTVDTDIRLYVHTMTGERIWALKIAAGEEGGHAGYNKVKWDGKDGFYNQLGNGVYLVHIVSAKGKLLGKVKILVIR